MTTNETKRRLVKFLSVDTRRSCNVIRFKDMITDEIIEVTAKGLQKLLQDVGLIGLELDNPKRLPSNSKRISLYYTVISTSLGDNENAQGKIVSTRSIIGDNRN